MTHVSRCLALALVLLVVTLDVRSACAQSVDGAVAQASTVSRDTLVVVRCGDARVGTAFAWSEAELATAWSVADCPRALSVEAQDGRRASARVVASDPEHDIALLATEDDLGLPVLHARRDEVALGERVVLVGTRGGERGLTVTSGAIASASADALLADAAPPGTRGGPALDVEGAVVGVVAWNDGSTTQLVPVPWLVALEDEISSGGDVRAPVRFHFGIDAGVLVLDAHALFAAETFLTADLWDALTLRIALLSAGGRTNEWAPQPLERGDALLAGGATLGYRFRLQLDDAFALTVTPEVGVWVGARSITDTTASVGFADPSCNPSMGTCAITTRTDTSSIERTLVRPTLGVRFGLGDAIELGYQLQLDVEHPEASGHLATFGFRL